MKNMRSLFTLQLRHRLAKFLRNRYFLVCIKVKHNNNIMGLSTYLASLIDYPVMNLSLIHI